MREIAPKAQRLVIGKIAPVPDELKAKVGPDETMVWVPKGLLKNIEWSE